MTERRAVKFKDRLYFPAFSSEYGREIFSTNGTPEGTTLLKDIYAGQKGMGISVSMAALDDVLLFAFEGEDGFFLWKTDGTENGTQKITEFQTFTTDGNFIVMNNAAYFYAFDEDHGFELWRSDGTAGGTFMVKDIYPGAKDAVIDVISAANNQIFFLANDGVHGRELWRSDGTVGGTTMVKDIDPDPNSFMSTYLTIVGNTVYFNAIDGTNGTQVWKSDGTEGGTAMITDFPLGDILFREKMFAFGNKLMFLHYTMAEGKEWYAIDLTTGDYEMLSNMDQDNGGGYSNVALTQPVIMNGYVWFIAAPDGTAEGIWKTDGTAEHTALAVDVDMLDFFLDKDLIAFNNKLYVTINFSLYETDGVNPLTSVLAGGGIKTLQEINGKLFFANGGEPWISDGTTLGSKILKDINAQPTFGIYGVRAVGERFIFFNNAVKNGVITPELWTSDGTTPGTVITRSFMDVPPVVAINGSKALFRATEVPTPPANPGINTWTSDATSAGTQPLDNGAWILTGEGAGYIQWVGNTAYMFNGDRQLYKTDGTAPATYISTLPKNFHGQCVALKNALYFFIDGELWKSDGTGGGTVKIVEVAPPGILQIVQSVMAGENKMYFTALTTANGLEVWTSDGTAGGTHIVKDVHVNDNKMYDYNAYHPTLQAVINDVAYFSGSETYDIELWRTDGTSAGTSLVKDIFPGAKGSSPAKVAQSGNTMYFTANDGQHGFELWKTDGTQVGTVMIKDIYPGKLSAFFSNTAASAFVNDVLYFTADDGTHGNELWMTDGTAAGTSFVLELNPGILHGISGATGGMVSAGTKLLFVGVEPQFGTELWIYDTVTPVTGIADDIESQVTVSPNPTTTSLLIRTPQLLHFRYVSLTDIFGRDVATTNITNEDTTIDVGHLARGMYLVKLKRDDNTTVVRKVILN